MVNEILTIGNKEYEMRYGMNVYCDMEKDGLDIFHISEDNFRFSEIRSLIYYGLKTCNKGITLNKTGDLIDAYISEGHTLADLLQKAVNVLKDSIGGSSEEEDGDSEKN